MENNLSSLFEDMDGFVVLSTEAISMYCSLLLHFSSHCLIWLEVLIRFL